MKRTSSIAFLAMVLAACTPRVSTESSTSDGEGASTGDELRLGGSVPFDAATMPGVVQIVVRTNDGFNTRKCFAVAVNRRVLLTLASCVAGATNAYIPGTALLSTTFHSFDYPLAGPAPAGTRPHDANNPPPLLTADPRYHDVAAVILPQDYVHTVGYGSDDNTYPSLATAVLAANDVVAFPGAVEHGCTIGFFGGECPNGAVRVTEAPIFAVGGNGYAHDYQIGPGPTGQAILQQQVNINVERYADGTRGGPVWASDLGGPVFKKGTRTLVGLASTTAGTNTYLSRTDDLHDWITAEIAAATPTTPPPSTSRITNLSTRVHVGTGDNVAIAGLILSGTGTKHLVVRALGPSLTAAGVSGALADPTIELHDGAGALVTTNDDWQTDANASVVQAAGLAPNDTRESALALTLSAGAYTVIVRGAASTTGIALVEAYDTDPAGGTASMTNLSTRGEVQSGDGVLIGGFVIDGADPKRVLVRSFPLPLAAALFDPYLELHAADGSVITTSDNYFYEPDAQAIDDTGYGRIGQNTGTVAQPDVVSMYSAAILRTLAPGAYTVVLRPSPTSPFTMNTRGIALLEIFPFAVQ